MALLVVGYFVGVGSDRHTSLDSTSSGAAEFGSGEDVAVTPSEASGVAGESAEPIALSPPSTAAAGPQVTVRCPEFSTADVAALRVSFDHEAEAGSSPIARYEIDYGDGRTYANRSDAGVFEHTYRSSGVWTIEVSVTDANGRSGTDSCVTGWTPLHAAPSPTYRAPTYAPPSDGSCGAGSYENVDGQCIPSPDYNTSGGGIPCADGTTSHATHRQGACSHHGGIA